MQQSEALMLARLTQVQKTEMMDKAINAIIVYLRDKVLREVVREQTAEVVRDKVLREVLKFYKVFGSQVVSEITTIFISNGED